MLEAIKSNPANEDAVAFTGFDFLGGGFRNNAATIFVTQKHWDERKVPTHAAGRRVLHEDRRTSRRRWCSPSTRRRSSAWATRAASSSTSRTAARAARQRLAEVHADSSSAAANKDPMLGGVQTLWRANVPQLYVDVDREKAKALGVPLDELYDTLAATLGTYYVNDFNKFGRTWQVLMSAEPAYRKRPGRHRRASTCAPTRGEMIPLASLATVRYTAGPDSLDRFNNLPAVKLFGQGAPGVSSGQAIDVVERIADEVLPPNSATTGAAPRSRRSAPRGTSALALGLAAVMVFLILAAQYEKWSLPLSVLLALPFGTFGALAAVWLRGLHQRRLLPDRPGDAARPRGEERHPDRRVRGAEAPRRLSRVGGGAGSGAAALPADPDDLARVHPRRAAAGDLDRRRRRRAPLGGHRRDGRHAGGDLPRDLLRADVLPRAGGSQAPGAAQC